MLREVARTLSFLLIENAMIPVEAIVAIGLANSVSSFVPTVVEEFASSNMPCNATYNDLTKCCLTSLTREFEGGIF